eukprot:m.204156 g.204156  ORF g.204156 m.204156 type:complete len:615 (-) comp22427_c0_seq1:85-1929(-)
MGDKTAAHAATSPQKRPAPHVTCVVLRGGGLAACGFKLKVTCHTAAVLPVTETRRDGLDPTSGDGVGTTNAGDGPAVVIVTQAPPAHRDLVGQRLVQAGDTALHKLTTRDLRTAVSGLDKGDDKTRLRLAVFTKPRDIMCPDDNGNSAGATRDRGRDGAGDGAGERGSNDTVGQPSIQGSIERAERPQATTLAKDGKSDSGPFVWQPESLVHVHNAHDQMARSGVALQWVRLPRGLPGGPFLHDYVRALDEAASSPALLRAVTALTDARPHTQPTVARSSLAQHQRYRPTALVFHCSRCGSTLVSNALRAWASADGQPGAVVSEPGALNDLLIRRLTRWTPGEVAATVADAAMTTVLDALGTDWVGETRLATPYIIKLSSWNILGADVILNTCRQQTSGAMRHDVANGGRAECPWVFVYRDPVEVAASELLHEGGWLRLGRHQPATMHRLLTRTLWEKDGTHDAACTPRHTDSSDDATTQSDGAPRVSLGTDIDILSETIGAYFDAALTALEHTSSGWVINYNDIVDHPQSALSDIYRALTGSDPPMPLDPTILSRYSKSPASTASTRQHNRVEDAHRKKGALAQTPGLTETVTARCHAAFLKLQAHERRLATA